MPKQTCPNCKREFTLGVDGVYDAKTKQNLCDPCAGVTRDAQGYAWSPGETMIDVSTGGITFKGRGLRRPS